MQNARGSGYTFLVRKCFSACEKSRLLSLFKATQGRGRSGAGECTTDLKATPETNRVAGCSLSVTPVTYSPCRFGSSNYPAASATQSAEVSGHKRIH